MSDISVNRNLTVEIDDQSGFCFGVVRAIRQAEEHLDGGDVLYCLGDIVHNSDEVERLRRRGLVTISHEDLESLHNAKVLLRAHGEPPSTYEVARRNNIEIIDATCPVVLKLQQRIKEAYRADDPLSPQIVIYGKSGHAEVNGLVGQTGGDAIVVDTPDSLERVDPERDVALYSQTTKSREGFESMRLMIEWRLTPGHKVSAYDTICRQVSTRVEHLRAFAASHDVVLFVAGAKSSNGRVLFAECQSVNPSSYLLSNASEFNPEWIASPDVTSVGVCGATSTPRWLMEEVAQKVVSGR